jgi:3'-phosphoadenosine 5'-phosphosulfate sulfotransferase (PAPS reductase)/FAD synthetase
VSNPFLIEGPAEISFSGGRTSAYMLRRVLDAGLQPDVHVLFANTGKERPETLDFVREVGERWGVNVRWLEYGRGEVDYATASRNGEPFEALIVKRSLLPNPVTRFCTSELKVRVLKDFMVGHGYPHWGNVVGIRADEPGRVARMRTPNRERWENVLPLAAAGVTVDAVMAFWKAQPFDLQLRPYQGNCDLCFLKGRAKKLTLIRENPASADWWAKQEEAMGARFRNLGPTYRQMQASVAASPLLPFPDAVFEDDADDLGDCVCHD